MNCVDGAYNRHVLEVCRKHREAVFDIFNSQTSALDGGNDRILEGASHVDIAICVCGAEEMSLPKFRKLL
jgi:hypothetical protein